jgi:pantetheine-phosphate adenylyltransferase
MKKPVAVYPGSFDPPTNGHLDIINRATHLFPRVIVAVTDNMDKKPTFSREQRLEMLRRSVSHLPTVSVDSFSGLLVNYLKTKKSTILIRGLRAISDFEYEFQMALMNRRLSRSVETVFLMPDEAYTYLSSSVIKQVARLGGSTHGLVPKHVEKCLSSIPTIPERPSRRR